MEAGGHVTSSHSGFERYASWRGKVADGATIVAEATQTYKVGAQSVSEQAEGYAWNQTEDALRRYSGRIY